jgi:hypothetical protein
MRHRTLRLTWILVLAALVATAPTAPVYAQGGATSTISGTVADSSGAVVPGADIVVKNNATGIAFTAVSGADGSFGIPAVPPGTYTITVKLMGFKTTVLNDVTANVAQVATVKAVLDLGTLEETVIVSGATEIVQTQATSVATTLTARQIASLPLPGRGAFDLVSFMPGVSTTTGSIRDSTVNGLPQSAVNITLDGMNIQDNYAKSWDGMFTRVSPRLDAVEEVTISTAAQGADMGSQGAAQVRFVTRSGTNKYQGSTYFYYRRAWMNSNTWFNLHRNVDAVTGKPTDTPLIFQDQPGGRIGGPIIKDKAFFFVNYEWISSPGSRTDNRTIMSPLSEQGQFQYAGGTIDLMALAGRNGQTARIDPIVAKLLADVRSSTSQGTVTTTIDPLTQTFAWSQNTKSTTKYPTVRLDYNVTSKHRISLSGTHNQLLSDPDTTNSMQAIYPGFPAQGLQDSARWSTQLSVRSTLTPTMVNELRVGGTGGATKFSPNLAVDMFSSSGVHCVERLQEHQQSVPVDHQQRARGFDASDREYAELAQGEAQPQPRGLRHAGRRVASEPATRADDHAWHGVGRSGRRHVHHGQLPRRVEHGFDQCEKSLCRVDRSHHDDHPRRPNCRGRQDLQHPGAEHAKGPHVASRSLCAGWVAGEIESDRERGDALRSAVAVLRPE